MEVWYPVFIKLHFNLFVDSEEVMHFCFKVRIPLFAVIFHSKGLISCFLRICWTCVFEIAVRRGKPASAAQSCICLWSFADVHNSWEYPRLAGRWQARLIIHATASGDISTGCQVRFLCLLRGICVHTGGPYWHLCRVLLQQTYCS